MVCAVWVSECENDDEDARRRSPLFPFFLPVLSLSRVALVPMSVCSWKSIQQSTARAAQRLERQAKMPVLGWVSAWVRLARAGRASHFIGPWRPWDVGAPGARGALAGDRLAKQACKRELAG